MSDRTAENSEWRSRIAARGLAHAYRRRSVLQDLAFELPQGVTVVLGPNGAGKSTLLRVLSATLRPTSGSVQIAGHSLNSNSGRASARALTGYLPQRFTLMSRRSALHNVAYAAWANGVEPNQAHDVALAALNRVGLADRAYDRVRQLSGGMRQRVGLACAAAHGPAVLLLDEPTVGLDPIQRVEFRESLRNMNDDVSIVLTTHLTDDVERVADRVLVLNEGRLSFLGSTDEFLGMASGDSAGVSPAEDAYRALIQSPVMP